MQVCCSDDLWVFEEEHKHIDKSVRISDGASLGAKRREKCSGIVKVISWHIGA